MDVEKSIFSSNLKYLRKAQGLNQDALAEKLNIKRSNLASYETKNVEPRLRIILEIARFFNIDLKSLLTSRLSDDIEYPSFQNESNKEIEQTTELTVDSKEINTFIDKTLKIKKILIGFKSFYHFRKAKLKEISPSNQKVIFDIENFIQLMEELITHNESMIRLLATLK